MKKIIYILVGISTFLFGVFSFYLRPVVTPISLCEATQNYEFYQFSNILIKADLTTYKQGDVLYVSEMKKGCIDAGADLVFSEDYEESETISKEKLNSEFAELKEKTIEQKSETSTAMADVIIKGRIVKRTMNCFAAPFYFEVEEIKQVSPVRIINIQEYRNKAKNN